MGYATAPTVAANDLFYYGSTKFDGGATSPSSADSAIATDKSPLSVGPAPVCSATFPVIMTASMAF